MDKYEKLTEDLRAAWGAAKLERASLDDGGTCNFDSPAIALSGYSASKLQEAILQAGFRSYKWRIFGKTFYVVSTGCGQGNRRTAVAEAVYRFLQAKGYDVTMYYQMD